MTDFGRSERLNGVFLRTTSASGEGFNLLWGAAGGGGCEGICPFVCEIFSRLQRFRKPMIYKKKTLKSSEFLRRSLRDFLQPVKRPCWLLVGGEASARFTAQFLLPLGGCSRHGLPQRPPRPMTRSSVGRATQGRQ